MTGFGLVYIMMYMKEATFTELRNNARKYFDSVERGDTVRIYRNGTASWKRSPTPLTIKGLALSREILKDRKRST